VRRRESRKGPSSARVASAAPYFHNRAAANLQQLVDFYDERFQMNFSPEQKEDLIAFRKFGVGRRVRRKRLLAV